MEDLKNGLEQKLNDLDRESKIKEVLWLLEQSKLSNKMKDVLSEVGIEAKRIYKEQIESREQHRENLNKDLSEVSQWPINRKVDGSDDLMEDLSQIMHCIDNEKARKDALREKEIFTKMGVVVNKDDPELGE